MHWLYVLIVLAAVIALVAARALTSHFECPNCGEHFQVGFIRYLFAPHMLGKRDVRCPKCGQSNFLAPKLGKN